MLQDRILEDFENSMERKRMIEQLPEVKDGGIMKKVSIVQKMIMMDMGGMVIKI